jgi:hypothetical protein
LKKPFSKITEAKKKQTTKNWFENGKTVDRTLFEDL